MLVLSGYFMSQMIETLGMEIKWGHCTLGDSGNIGEDIRMKHLCAVELLPFRPVMKV